VNAEQLAQAKKHWGQSPISIDIYCIGRSIEGNDTFVHAQTRWSAANFAYDPPTKDGGEPTPPRWVLYGDRERSRHGEERPRPLRGTVRVAAHLAGDNYVEAADAERVNYDLECECDIDAERGLKCHLACDVREEKLYPILDTLAAHGIKEISLLELAAILRRSSA
jgi:hypothetical protein